VLLDEPESSEGVSAPATPSACGPVNASPAANAAAATCAVSRAEKRLFPDVAKSDMLFLTTRC